MKLKFILQQFFEVNETWKIIFEKLKEEKYLQGFTTSTVEKETHEAVK